VLTRDFDFHLPDASIAQEPSPRGMSRLLVMDEDDPARRHRKTRDLPEVLRPGDLLVVNDTRVIPARLFGHRLLAEDPETGQAYADGPSPGGKVELLLVEREDDSVWQALAKPGKKARAGDRLRFGDGDDSLEAEILELLDDGRRRVRFDAAVEPHLDRLGHVPLPPYIHRPDRPEDRERYQTVYARSPGAVAAPTAGLHFTEEIFARAAERGIDRASVTLHVGIGTFKPVTASLVHEHQMESERYEVPEATAEAIFRTRRDGGRVVAVGTTVVRTLESAVRVDGVVQPGSGRTELFITPGFQFHAVDVLVTNFHLPCSTLLMMVSAFAGPDGRERVLAAYEEAVREGYRFYSYGDAMVVERARSASSL
jgi:S-adenosylmethionine:tRNA ribosyltransferase-isomerase